MAEQRVSRRKTAAFWLILLTIMGGMAFVVLEVGLRLLASWAFATTPDSPLIASSVPGLHYQLRPNHISAKVTTDAYGFRKRPDDQITPQLNVLVLGDSIAFSNGLTYEKSFSPLLEKTLTAEMREPVAVWNGAAPGYNTDQEAVQLEIAYPRIKPDLVILEVCMNDYMEPVRLSGNGMLDAMAGDPSLGRLSPMALFTASRAVVFAKEKLKDAQEQWPEMFPRWMHYVHYLHRKPGWVRVKNSLLRMQRLTEAHNAKFLVVLFPLEQQLRISDRTVLNDLQAFADAHGMKVLDLYPAFQKHWREGLYVDYWKEVGSVDKLHLNARGHRIAAEQMAQAILGPDRLLAKRAAPESR